MRREDGVRRLHAEMFRGGQVERKGGRFGFGRRLRSLGLGRRLWELQSRLIGFRWSLDEIDQSVDDGKSRAQEPRHVD